LTVAGDGDGDVKGSRKPNQPSAFFHLNFMLLAFSQDIAQAYTNI